MPTTGRPLRVAAYPPKTGNRSSFFVTLDDLVAFINIERVARKPVRSYELIYAPVSADISDFKYYVIAQGDRVAVIEDIRL